MQIKQKHLRPDPNDNLGSVRSRGRERETIKTPRWKMPSAERSQSLLRTSPVEGREGGREVAIAAAAAAAAAGTDEDARLGSSGADPGDARSSRKMRTTRAAAWEELRDPPLLSAQVNSPAQQDSGRKGG